MENKVKELLQSLEQTNTNQMSAEEKLHQNAEKLALLLKTNESLSKSLELPEILQTLTDSATKVFNNGSAAVYTLKDNMLILGATTPPLPPNFPDNLRLAQLKDHPTIQKTMESKSPVIIPDTRNADFTKAEKEITEIRNLYSIIYFPLIGPKKTLGVYMVAFTNACQPISEFQKTLCNTLATQASIAIENAYLYKSVKNELEERKRAEKEKEQVEAKLIQAQKMESIGRLAGGVAHDYNNMLSVILGYSDMALKRVDKDDVLRTYIQEINAAAVRSSEITRQLLAFSRKQTISPKVLNLNKTLEGMLKMLQRLIGDNIELIWEPAPNPWNVYIDPSQLDQILVNLCVNARDAIPDVGKIIVKTGIDTFDEAYCSDNPGYVPGEFVCLTVSDNGIGMDKITQKHLFEPFFTTKEKGKGTGLGLSTVYGIVKQNNGLINVYSEPGHGTTFRIYFPRYIGSGKQINENPKPKQVTGGNETILLVEDDQMILTMTKIMLDKMGYNILQAENASDAIDLFQKNKNQINLLITDVVMPEMNGYELAKKIQKIAPDLKILFMSGYTSDVIAHHGVLEEGVNFIQKPFSNITLSEKIREILKIN